jgi:anti-sigma B factor antagonist
MNIKFDVVNGVGVFAVTGRIDAAEAPKLKQSFPEWLIKTNDFVFDASGVEFIDSTGLGCLVSCLRQAVENNGNIKIFGLQAKPRMVFEITRAYKIFDIFDDLNIAIKSFKD